MERPSYLVDWEAWEGRLRVPVRNLWTMTAVYWVSVSENFGARFGLTQAVLGKVPLNGCVRLCVLSAESCTVYYHHLVLHVNTS